MRTEMVYCPKCGSEKLVIKKKEGTSSLNQAKIAAKKEKMKDCSRTSNLLVATSGICCSLIDTVRLTSWGRVNRGVDNKKKIGEEERGENMRRSIKGKGIASGVALTLICTAFVVVPFGVSADSLDFAGGDGTEGNPYQIATIDHLQNIELDLSAHYILVNDIDASVTSGWDSDGSGGYYGFDPIGDYTNKFTGSLDGQGYSIIDLYINRSSIDYAGLFGYIDSGGLVMNVILVNVSVRGRYYVGGFVGYNNDGTVSNCYATGTFNGRYYVGGFVGYNNDGTAESCYAIGNVSGIYHVGGFVGYNNDGTVSNCSAAGTVSGNGGVISGLVGTNDGGTVLNCYVNGNVKGVDYVGDLVGQNYDGLISNCYATGNVSGNYFVGGLVGLIGSGSVSNCYATSNVSGNYYFGGLVGYDYSGSVSNSFWDTETSGQVISNGGTGKTTSEMMNIATFTDTSTTGLISSWDFIGDPNDDTGSEDIWDINEGMTYPYLSWQIPNQPPIADADGPYIADEGTAINFNASGSSDPDGDELEYRWDFDNNTIWDMSYSTDPTATNTWYDDYCGDVVVEVNDGEVTDTDITEVTVNNIAPTAVIDSVIQPFSEFILPNDELEFYGSFTDPGTEDTHTIEWDFDDSTVITGTLTPTHTYTEPGIYTVTLTVYDDDGGVGTASVEIAVKNPVEATEDIIEDIKDMELPKGIENSLVSKLENAIDSMEQENEKVSINKFEAFINQVEAQRGKKLSNEEADVLIAAAQAIIDNLQG